MKMLKVWYEMIVEMIVVLRLLREAVADLLRVMMKLMKKPKWS
jgi:hypothetical protein